MRNPGFRASPWIISTAIGALGIATVGWAALHMPEERGKDSPGDHPGFGTLAPSATRDQSATDVVFLGATADFPSDLVVYFIPVGTGGAGARLDLRRAFRDDSGLIREEKVYLASDSEPFGLIVQPWRRVVAITVCEAQQCSLRADPRSPQPATGYLSVDGGETFTPLGTFPLDCVLAGAAPPELIVECDGSLHFFPSGSAVDPPRNGLRLLSLAGEEPLWLAESGEVVSGDGSTILQRVETSAGAVDVVPNLNGGLSQYRSWSQFSPGEPVGIHFLEVAGPPKLRYRWAGGPIEWLSELPTGEILAQARSGDGDFQLLVVDLAESTAAAVVWPGSERFSLVAAGRHK